MSIRAPKGPDPKFMHAATFGDPLTVKQFIPQARKFKGAVHAALVRAIESGHEAVIELLLAEPMTSAQRQAARLRAAASGNRKALEKLWSGRGEGDGSLLLLSASRNGHLDAVKFLLDEVQPGADDLSAALAVALGGNVIKSPHTARPVIDILCSQIDTPGTLRKVLSNWHLLSAAARSELFQSHFIQWLPHAPKPALEKALNNVGATVPLKGLQLLACAAKRGAYAVDLANALARDGRLDHIKVLLEHGHVIDASAALTRAASAGHVQVMKELWPRIHEQHRAEAFSSALNAAADLSDHSAPAAAEKSRAAVQWLLALSDPIPGSVEKALLTAIKGKQVALVDDLLARGRVTSAVLRVAAMSATPDMAVASLVFAKAPPKKLSSAREKLHALVKPELRAQLDAAIDHAILSFVPPKPRSTTRQIQTAPPKSRASL